MCASRHPFAVRQRVSTRHATPRRLNRCGARRMLASVLRNAGRRRKQRVDRQIGVLHTDTQTHRQTDTQTDTGGYRGASLQPPKIHLLKSLRPSTSPPWASLATRNKGGCRLVHSGYMAEKSITNQPHRGP